jgi:putative tryptophan/tyrosine transport system substrate-binding protein
MLSPEFGEHMQRREFIKLIGGVAAAWPFPVRAQQRERMRLIGMLMNFPESDPIAQSALAAFQDPLTKLGWMKGSNLRIELRWGANDPDRMRMLAKELVALHPDVILAHSTPAAAAVQQESRTIPIVFVRVSDPIGSGFVANLARPGGNLTGFLFFEPGIVGKWLSMLKEMTPRLARAALVANPKTTPFDYFSRAAETAAPSLAIELVPSHVENAADIERAVESVARVPNGGLVILPDATMFGNRDLIIALAARYRLPAVYYDRPFVTAGGLMSYGLADSIEPFQQAASYVDRILRGEKPADLPVTAPTKYSTIVNLKTAKALGLTVPPGLMVAADEVIE